MPDQLELALPENENPVEFAGMELIHQLQADMLDRAEFISNKLVEHGETDANNALVALYDHSAQMVEMVGQQRIVISGLAAGLRAAMGQLDKLTGEVNYLESELAVAKNAALEAYSDGLTAGEQGAWDNNYLDDESFDEVRAEGYTDGYTDGVSAAETRNKMFEERLIEVETARQTTEAQAAEYEQALRDWNAWANAQQGAA